jgi:hypothetical protein
MRRPVSGIVSVLLAALLSACGALAGTNKINPADTASSSGQSLIQSAYAEPLPDSRHNLVLNAVDLYLRSQVNRNQSDSEIEKAITDAAFASKSLIFTEPAYVRSQGETLIVSLPDGLGLYLYDLRSSPGTPPVLISSWTAHLINLSVTWQPLQAGILYNTSTLDGNTQAHFALLEQGTEGWFLSWLSDDSPDWWLTGRNAEVLVSSDLQSIQVVGESQYTTSVFRELSGNPVRRFSATWQRNSTGYSPQSAPGTGKDRQAWAWQAAVPSPYATLVEFVERLRASQQATAASLVASDQVIENALAFGVASPEDAYTVISVTDTTISYQGLHGVFVVTFVPPAAAKGKWLIQSLLPIDAVPPTPTATS